MDTQRRHSIRQLLILGLVSVGLVRAQEPTPSPMTSVGAVDGAIQNINAKMRALAESPLDIKRREAADQAVRNLSAQKVNLAKDFAAGKMGGLKEYFSLQNNFSNALDVDAAKEYERAKQGNRTLRSEGNSQAISSKFESQGVANSEFFQGKDSGLAASNESMSTPSSITGSQEVLSSAQLNASEIQEFSLERNPASSTSIDGATSTLGSMSASSEKGTRDQALLSELIQEVGDGLALPTSTLEVDSPRLLRFEEEEDEEKNDKIFDLEANKKQKRGLTRHAPSTRKAKYWRRIKPWIKGIRLMVLPAAAQNDRQAEAVERDAEKLLNIQDYAQRAAFVREISKDRGCKDGVCGAEFGDKVVERAKEKAKEQGKKTLIPTRSTLTNGAPPPLLPQRPPFPGQGLQQPNPGMMAIGSALSSAVPMIAGVAAQNSIQKSETRAKRRIVQLKADNTIAISQIKAQEKLGQVQLQAGMTLAQAALGASVQTSALGSQIALVTAQLQNSLELNKKILDANAEAEQLQAQTRQEAQTLDFWQRLQGLERRRAQAEKEHQQALAQADRISANLLGLTAGNSFTGQTTTTASTPVPSAATQRLLQTVQASPSNGSAQIANSLALAGLPSRAAVFNALSPLAIGSTPQDRQGIARAVGEVQTPTPTQKAGNYSRGPLTRPSTTSPATHTRGVTRNLATRKPPQ